MITISQHDLQLWGGLAMAAAGAVVLLALVLGIAIGLGVRMFEICSGHAQFARKRNRRSRHRLVPYHANGEISSLASQLSQPVLDRTEPMERVED
jgi:hypothetical protein